MEEQKTIIICESHQRDYPTPLIYTFAFIHCEYWCPYCGNKHGMFDGGKDVPWTQELQDRHDKYKFHYQEYLHASVVSYSSGTMWKGERIHPKDLPDDEKSRLKTIRQTAWKENIKIEEMR